MIFLRFSDTIDNRMKDARRTEEKVFSYIEKHHMLQPGDRVVAGVSGGADSLCLLFVLLEWAKKAPLSLAVVHVDHGLRQESGEDALYVKELCRRLKLPFYLTRENVKQRAEMEKCSQEEAGRKIRYKAFRRAAEGFGADKIAVAHNSNDCSETMLFHLFRGSGLKGLCGIPPVREEIIRPLLCLESEEIRNYLCTKRIPWREDSTNREDHYTRNRIRHHILPYVEREISPGCVIHMSRTAELLSETEEYMEEQTAMALNRCAVFEGTDSRMDGAACAVLDRESFMREHPSIRKRILLQLMKCFSPEQQDIGYVHIQALMALFIQEGNRGITLPFGIKAEREYGKIFLNGATRDPKDKDKPRQNIHPAAVRKKDIGESPVTIGLGEWGKAVFSVFPYEKGLEVPENKYTKWFDYDKIKESLVIRTRQPGDYLTLNDGEGREIHKSLKKYMIGEKIPQRERGDIPVLAQGSHILWLFGWRVSETYKINWNTKRILQVKLERDCSGSKTEEGYGGEH